MRGRMSGARCMLLRMRNGMFVCLFAVLTSAAVVPFCGSLFAGLTSTSPSTVFTSTSHLLYISSYIYLNNKTLTSPKQLRLRSLPPRRRSALDGSPQDPHPHPTPPQPCMAPTATSSSRLEEPIIHQMPSIHEMGRPPADRPHTTSPTTLTSPASLTGTGSIGRTYTTDIRLHIRYNDTYTIKSGG
jgi:hypothetical protein